MPFTLAHPAIVLPFLYLPRKWISMTGLAIGALVPDAEAFLRMYSHKDFTHSWFGFLVFGIPFGVFLSFVFHNIARDPLINHLPSFLLRRFSIFTRFNWNKRFAKHWFVVIVSIVVGGATHFFWDNFSHFDGWLFQKYPGLKGNIVINEKELEIPFLIQYISTLLGVLVLLIYVLLRPKMSAAKYQGGQVKFWSFVILLTLLIFFTRIKLINARMPDDLIIGLISSFAFGLLISSVIFRERH